MGLKTTLRLRKAIIMQSKGDIAGAREIYEEAYAQGENSARYLLAYSVMLLRSGEYAKAKEVLLRAQKAPDLSPQQRQQLHMNYAVASYRLGDLPKAIELLEAQHQKNPCGMIYESLGFLYVEGGDADKALAYNLEALDYDDTDPIVLDNLAQVYYRMLDDKPKAKEYFERAIAEKPNQIDTLYFLSRYDLENGDKAAAREKLELAAEGRFSPLNYMTREQIQSEIDALDAE